MKKLFVFLSLSFGSVCYGAFKTDALNITTSSITINGTSYNWQAGAGTAGQCLTTDGGNPPTLTWETCGVAPTDDFVLLEDGTFVLLEDGGKVIIE